MQRRSFLVGSASFSAVGLSGLATPAIAASRARILKQEVDGVKRPWRYKKMNDPTGSAPTRRVERFELRNGDCSHGDCKFRQGPRGPEHAARTEHHIVTNLKAGDEGQFVYHVYFPSKGYNFLPNVITNTGQLYLYDRPDKDWDGGPIWMLRSEPGSRKMVIRSVQQGFENGRIGAEPKVRVHPIGALGKTIKMDSWNQIVLNFKLSPGNDGRVSTFINGRGVLRTSGPTAPQGTVLGLSYGIYQNRVNQFPGGAKKIPPQVVYYAGVRLLKL